VLDRIHTANRYSTQTAKKVTFQDIILIYHNVIKVGHFKPITPSPQSFIAGKKLTQTGNGGSRVISFARNERGVRSFSQSVERRIWQIRYTSLARVRELVGLMGIETTRTAQSALECPRNPKPTFNDHSLGVPKYAGLLEQSPSNGRFLHSAKNVRVDGKFGNRDSKTTRS
jgi:hypothetical protein